MLRRFLAGALGALLLSTPMASANAQDFDNNRILYSFTVQNVQDALRAAGATEIDVQEGTDGEPRVVGTFSESRKVIMTPRACETNYTNCRGLSLRAFWSKSSNKSTAEVLGAIQEHNRTAVSFGILNNDDNVVLSFYIIGDYGMAQGNVAVATLVFLSELSNLRATTHR